MSACFWIFSEETNRICQMLYSISFCIIEGPETLQDFVQMQLQEIKDNIKSRRNKIFLLMEEVFWEHNLSTTGGRWTLSPNFNFMLFLTHSRLGDCGFSSVLRQQNVAVTAVKTMRCLISHQLCHFFLTWCDQMILPFRLRIVGFINTSVHWWNRHPKP